MATEIERKFLIADESWRAAAGAPQLLRQGYLALTERAVMRVRLADERTAWLGVKENRIGRSHSEYEYRIPPQDARELLALCTGVVIDKRRYRVPVGAHEWEVDEFAGANAGLVLAEVELSRESETFERPRWLGREVTDERRYYNAALALHPWRDWEPDARQ